MANPSHQQSSVSSESDPVGREGIRFAPFLPVSNGGPHTHTHGYLSSLSLTDFMCISYEYALLNNLYASQDCRAGSHGVVVW